MHDIEKMSDSLMLYGVLFHIIFKYGMLCMLLSRFLFQSMWWEGAFTINVSLIRWETLLSRVSLQLLSFFFFFSFKDDTK